MKRLQQITAVLLLALAMSQPAAIAQKMPEAQLPQFKKDTFNIVKYKAIADGVTLNTKSINAAIADCAAKGGGVVLIPGGLWLTGPLELKSNVNLHLAKNALLQFTTDFDQYQLVAGNWEGLPAVRNQSPISGTGLENIAITGHGIIDGAGDAWRMVKKDKLTESQWKRLTESGGVMSDDKKTWYPSEKSVKGLRTKDAGVLKDGKTVKDFEDIKDFLRPNLLVLTKCKKVLLDGVTFQNSPAWCLHPLMCQDLTVRNVYAKNPWYAQNGDGIDIESCKNILLENNTFDVGDDGICIKSGRDEEGRKRNMPTENAVIRNCVVYHAHGGFVIGSEMSGGARNLYVYDCTFIGTDVGLRFKTTRGRGGIVEKIYVNNINMKDIAGEAILFDMYYMAKDPVPLAGEKREPPKVETLPVTEATPRFRDFHVSNIRCNGAEKGIFIRGLPEMNVEDVHLDNMVLKTKKGVDCTEASGIHFNNIQIISEETDPVINIFNCKNISFNSITYKQDAALLFNVSGEKSSDITVSNTDASKAKDKVQFNYGATGKALRMQ